jgi:hypothetical protein
MLTDKQIEEWVKALQAPNKEVLEQVVREIYSVGYADGCEDTEKELDECQ